MKKEDERFVVTYRQGAMRIFEIWVDRETGVNYIFTSYGNAGGITPLLDKNGYAVVTDPATVTRL